MEENYFSSINSRMDINYLERRSKPRVNVSLPAIVRGYPATGNRFEAKALLANMSANGMYLHLKRSIRVGERIFVFVRLSPEPTGEVVHPQIAASGTAVRTEVLPDGSYGVGVQLHQHRFI